MTSSVAVASYVFFEFETTGLPKQENNLTRATELSLVAVKRAHILDCEDSTPRVQHKLTLCIDPGRPIGEYSTKLTGLTNKLLKNETPFNDNVFNAMLSFLSTLEKPICLLAHNGLKFYFPILKALFKMINKELSDDVLCADTLHAYYDIYKNNDPARRGSPDKNARRRLEGYDLEGTGLIDVYKSIFNQEPVKGHRAEADCILNLEIAVASAENFVMWVDGNCCILNNNSITTMGDERHVTLF